MRALRNLWAIAGTTAVTVLWIGVIGVPRSTWAADDACYMVTSSGKRVSLGKLCQGASPSRTQPRTFFEARIKRQQGGTPVIDVVFNGNRTYEMLVDTGATKTLITRTMAQSLNIPVIGAGRFTMADGRMIVMPVGRLNSLSVDGAVIRNVDVAIAGDYAEGLLGSDFLGNYDIKIKRNVIEFYPRS